VFFGGTILQSYDWHLHLPLLGDLHLVSSTVFDVGVYLVVVGMLLDVARSLGSGIDQHASEEIAPMPIPDSTKAIPGRLGGAS
jgi:multicomponent Na+:H+ antiporter subunit A